MVRVSDHGVEDLIVLCLEQTFKKVVLASGIHVSEQDIIKLVLYMWNKLQTGFNIFSRKELLPLGLSITGGRLTETKNR